MPKYHTRFLGDTMMPKSLCDRVYVIGGPGISHPADCCVYLVDAGKELVMIDCGAGLGLDAILKNVKSLNLSSEVCHVVATHCHIDHIGGVSSLKEICGCKVVAHVQDAEGIELGDPKLTAADLYGIDYWPVKIDMVLHEELETHIFGDLDLHFLHAPGHTPGSIVVYLDVDGERILFGQDVHGPFSDNWASDIDMWRKSMQKLLDLNADILCEGHAGVFRGKDVKNYIDSQLRRHQHA